MAKRKSLNKRYSRYSRGSGGSDVLNPDTNILGDEYPYWWKNLENNTIYRPSADSTNFNQTSRRLNSNTSIRTSNEPDNDWWKDLEGTTRNSRSLRKYNDLSKRDGTDGAPPAMSESEEELQIAKKKPALRSESKKNDGNAFQSVLNDSRVLLVPLEKDPSVLRSKFAQKCFPPTVAALSRESSSSGSPVAKPKPKLLRKAHTDRNANASEGDELATPSRRTSSRNLVPTDKRLSNAARFSLIASSTDPRVVQNSLNENENDLSNFSLPKATSTLLDNSMLLQQTTSNSDTEPVVMKPKSKLLRRHNRDTKKNLFENVLMEDKIDEEKDADRPALPSASALVDESAEEPEPRIEVDETIGEPEPRIIDDDDGSKLVDKKLHPTTGVQDSASDSSDTSCAVLDPAKKPKSRFLRVARRSDRENLFQRILDDSDLTIKNVTANVPDERESTLRNGETATRRPSVISADSNGCSEDVHLRLSNSSNASDVDIIRGGDGKLSSARNNHAQTTGSQPEGLISPSQRSRTTRKEDSKTENVRSSSTEKSKRSKSRGISGVYETEALGSSAERQNGGIDRSGKRMTASSTEKSKRSGSSVKRLRRSRGISSVSETEALEAPTERQNGGTDRLEEQTVDSSVVATEKDRLEAEGARQTRGNRQSRPRRVTSLLSPSDLEEGHVDNRQSRPRKATPLRSPSDLEEGHVSKRQSTPRRTTPLRSPSDLVEGHVDNRQSRPRRATPLRSPSNLEEGHVSKRQSRPRRATSLVPPSDLEEGHVSKRQSRPRRATPLRSPSDLEEGHVDNRQSKPRRATPLRFPSNLEEGHVNNRQSRPRRATPLRPSNDLEEGHVDNRQSRPRRVTPLRSPSNLEEGHVRTRQSKPRRATPLRSPSDLEEGHVSKRQSRPRKATPLRSPSNLEEGHFNNRQSKPRRATPLLSPSDLEQGHFNNRRSRPRKATPLRSPSNLEEGHVSKRQSKPRRATPLLSPNDLEEGHFNNTQSKPRRATPLRSPSDLEQGHFNNRRSKPRRVTSLLSPSDLEEEHAESPTATRSKRIDSSKNEIVTMYGTKNEEAIDASNPARRRSQWHNNVREGTRLHFTTEPNSDEDGSDSADDDRPARTEYPARSRSRSLSNVGRAGSLHFRTESGTEEDPPPSSPKNRSSRGTQIRVVSIDSRENASALSVQLVDNFLETHSSRSEGRSLVNDVNDGGGAVSPSAIPTSEAETEYLRRPSSTSLRARASGGRPTLSRVEHCSDGTADEEEREKTGTDHDARKKLFAVGEVESASSNRPTTQPRPETDERSLKPRDWSGSNVGGDAVASTGGEPEGRRSSLFARESRGPSVGSIARQQDTLSVADDQIAERVGSDSASWKQSSRPGPGGKSESLRPLSLNRLEEAESARGRAGEEVNSRSKIVPGRAAKGGSGKAKGSTDPRVCERSQRTIRDFLETKMGGATSASQGLANVRTVQEIRMKLEEIKRMEVEGTREIRRVGGASERNKYGKGSRPRSKQRNSVVPRNLPHPRKAYLVNGQVYKQPRLPRPMRWVTDRLYQYLWKQMQAKYGLETRVQSEKFVRRLSEVAAVIAKRKTYVSYRNELHALMKEMARLRIIHSRNDFYHFCYDFLPYELRVKMVPILMPGNRTGVPYDPDELHEPLLSP